MSNSSSLIPAMCDIEMLNLGVLKCILLLSFDFNVLRVIRVPDSFLALNCCLLLNVLKGHCLLGTRTEKCL